MDSSSVQTPCVSSPPYFTDIPDGMYPSKSITVSGTVLPTAQRFEINLRSGSDIALQMGPNFDRNSVVRKSFINGCWGHEETFIPGPMPFSRGKSFSVRITCDNSSFKVAVNDQDLFDYNHRLKDLRSITVLEVAGDVNATNVQK